ALPAQPGLQRPHRARPLLSRLRRADGAFRRGVAGLDPPGDLRGHGGGHRERGPPAARPLWTAVRARVPSVPRDAPRRPHGELRHGSPAHLPRGARAVAQLRAVARAAEGRPWTRARALAVARMDAARRKAALDEAAGLLTAAPDGAERVARRVLDATPGDPNPTPILRAALPRQREADEA